MKLGFCGGIDMAAAVREWGYDYIELALAPLAQMTEADFAAARKSLAESGLPCLACNIFLPRTVPVVGPAVDRKACDRYAEIAVARAAAIGAKVIVFGSAGARNVPGGFPHSRALAQLKDFATVAAGYAARHDLTIVMEPLNGIESNIMNRVSEALIMTLAVDHPNFKVLADTYHMDIERESLAALQMAGDDLRHIHVSTFLGRKIPLAEDKEPLTALFHMLKSIDYQGNVSVEAGFREDQAAEAREALTLMRSLL